MEERDEQTGINAKPVGAHLSDTSNVTNGRVLSKVRAKARTNPHANQITSISHRRFLREIIWLFDALACFVIAVTTTTIYHQAIYGLIGDLLTESMVLGAMSGLLFVILGSARGLYRPGTVFLLGEQISIILKVWVMVALFFLMVLFIGKFTSEFSRGAGMLFLVITPILLIGSRIVAHRLAHNLTQAGGPLNLRVAVVGPRDHTEEFLRLSRTGTIGLSVMGTFDPDRQDGVAVDQPSADKAGHSIRGTLRDLKKLARETRVDQIMISMPWSDGGRIEEVVEELASIPVPISLSPDPAAFRFSGKPIKIIGGVPYFDVRPRRIDGFQGMLKIAMDKVFSAILLIGLAPVFLVVALAIKLDSKGPVFFRQRRNGFNHNVFPIMKFRTMTTTDDGPVVRQATKGDSRITRLGAFLRRTSIDELPQLLNVLRGEMSLVGPRPHAVAHNEEYVKVVARYARRHNVKPGITGWAQVNGYRGETDTMEKLDGRIAHDLWYIEHWSLWLDIRILFMTALKVLGQRNAY